MEEELGALDTLVQEKLDADVEFQASIVDMSDEDRESALKEKREQVIKLSFAELREEAKKNAELAQNYKVRSEKAEKGGKTATTKAQEDLSTRDLYSLMQAQVPQEDVDEVVKAAKVLGKTIQEALKDPIVTSILKRNDDYRKTAQASNVGKAKAGTKTVTPDEIIRQTNEGNVPAAGTKEAEELFWARRGGRRQ